MEEVYRWRWWRHVWNLEKVFFGIRRKKIPHLTAAAASAAIRITTSTTTSNAF